MASKENQSWNTVNEKNIDQCLKLVDEYPFERLQLPNDIQDFVLDTSFDHHCDPKVFLYATLAGVGHFSESANVYNLETKQIKPFTVYQILIAPSGKSIDPHRTFSNSDYLGVEKSKYINLISDACTKLEYYVYEHWYKRGRSSPLSESIDNQRPSGEKRGGMIKSFDCWVNEFGSIKQVYTTPSLLHMMSSTNLFLLANEGDAILQECSFYNPSDVTADVKQGTLIDCK